MDCSRTDLATRWRAELRPIFQLRTPWLTSLELAVVDAVVMRPGITRTELYDKVVAAGFRLEDVHDGAQHNRWVEWDK